MMYTAAILFILLYSGALFFWHRKIKARVGPLASQWLKRLHYLLVLLAIVLIFLSTEFQILAKGQWTTRVVVVLALFTGVGGILVLNTSATRRIEKVYFRLFSFLPIVASMILCIPFLGLVIMGSLFGRLTDHPRIDYQDEHIRIEQKFKGILSGPQLEIIEQKAIYDRLLYSKPVSGYSVNDSAGVAYASDSTRVIIYHRYAGRWETKTVSFPAIH